MVMILKPDATAKDVEYVCRRAASLGLKTHVSEHNGQIFVGLLGDLKGLELSALAGLRGVAQLRPLSRPFQLASRDFKPEPTVVTVGEHGIGAQKLAIMAGPCSVESLESMLTIAHDVKKAGAQFLRGGAFKPRSSPYAFRGLAQQGLETLAEARRQTGLLIVTEVLASEHIDLVTRYTDVIQIGARNMQNYALLDAIGETHLPVLLKRGMSSTIEEFLLSAEYILSHGSPNVILCERGIRTFETATRNSLDINSVPLLKELSHLPVIVDPSHATGKASLVSAASRAAVAAGADGLIIEVHHDPERAWSDGFQTVSTSQFAELMAGLDPVAHAVGRCL